MTSRIKFILPFCVLFLLFGLLWHELFYAKPSTLPSTLIGEPVPNFQLQTLFAPSIVFTQKELHGHVSLLNVFASWCYACNVEAPMLMKISHDYHVPIYGIDYKDNPEEVRKWLKQHGNPYVLIGSDKNGDTAIDLGVYGTPETFIINSSGKIVYRHVGVIDQKNWDDVLYPLIIQLQKEKA